MYFAPFGGVGEVGEERAASIYWSAFHFFFLLLLLITTVSACDYVVNFNDKIIKWLLAKI